MERLLAAGGVIRHARPSRLTNPRSFIRYNRCAVRWYAVSRVNSERPATT